MIIDLIEKSKKSKTLIGFNFYGTDGGFYCGYVLEYNDDFVIIQHFSKFGVYDGLLTHKLSDIKYYETDTDYLRGIELMIQHQQNMLSQTYQLNPKNDFGDNFTNLFESFIGNKEYIIKFELTDEDIFFGFVEWCDENYFTIIHIDNDGMTIGKATFKYEDLKLYWIDDLECRKRKLLFHARNVVR